MFKIQKNELLNIISYYYHIDIRLTIDMDQI